MNNKIYIKTKPMPLHKLLVLAIGLFSFFSATNAQTFMPVDTTIDGNIDGYWEYLPENYDPAQDKKYPLLIAIHGDGVYKETDHKPLNDLKYSGIPKLINQGLFPKNFQVGDSTFSFIVIAPQMNTDTRNPDMLKHLINHCKSKYKVRSEKIYLTGLSHGGGTVLFFSTLARWTPGDIYVQAAGDYFTAVAPVCPNYWVNQDKKSNIARFMADAGIPASFFHNDEDPRVPVGSSILWVDSLNKVHANPAPLLTIFERKSHDAWTKAYDPATKVNGLNMYQWMLQYSRVNNTTVTSFLRDTTVADTLSAVADAFVRDGSDTITNHGFDSLLMVKKDGTGLNREAYFKFTVPNSGTITNAGLQLYGYNNGTTANTTQWQLWKVNDNSWTEGGINWKNKPAKNTLLATINGDTLPGFYNWDVTSALQSLQAGTISLAIVSTVSGTSTQVTFGSKERTVVEKRPKLIVTYSSQNYGCNADSYVRGGTGYYNNNYGSESGATVKYDVSNSYTRYAYFKFVIPAKNRQAAVNAKLQLYSATAGPTANTAKWVLYSAGKNWTEGGITWNNQPIPGTAIDSINGSSTPGFYDWNITNYINNLTSDTVSLVLKCSYTDSTSSQVSFSTKEATTAANRPQVILDFADTSSGARIISAASIATLSEKSIKQPELPATVFVYPNPLRNSCLIQSKKTIKAITLFDAAGRPVKTVTSVNAKQYRLSIPGVAKGIYFLIVKGDGFSDKKTLNVQ